MKKNINSYILRVLVLFLAFTACNVDDDAAVLAENQEIILVSLDKSGEHIISPSDGADVVIKAILSKPIANLSQIILDVNGVEQIKQLSAGETTFTISAPNTVGNVMEVTLKEAKAINTKLDLGANISVKITTVPEADPDNVLVTLNLSATNANNFYFTFAAFNADGSWIQDIFGGLNTSTISLPIDVLLSNSADILPDYFAIDIYSSALNNPNYSISVVQPDGSASIFSGSNLELSGSVDQDVILVDVSDSTTPGEKTYTFTQN